MTSIKIRFGEGVAEGVVHPDDPLTVVVGWVSGMSLHDCEWVTYPDSAALRAGTVD